MTYAKAIRHYRERGGEGGGGEGEGGGGRGEFDKCGKIRRNNGIELECAYSCTVSLGRKVGNLRRHYRLPNKPLDHNRSGKLTSKRSIQTKHSFYENLVMASYL